MIKVGVLGATGYAGSEVVRLIASHPDAELVLAVSQSFAGKKISEVYPNLRGVCDIELSTLDVADASEKCDVVFTALPHGASKAVIPELYERGLKVIDLSGDFRYNDAKVYEEWYGEKHSSPELLNESVYGLCELHRDEIKSSRLIGNPGCYTTCSILALAPLVYNKAVDLKNLIIDAKSGVTGAGRSASLPNIYCEVNESLKAYKVASHRHTSEIEQELSILAGEPIVLSFTPHLVPMQRGIFSTCYANLTRELTEEDAVEMYREFYKDERFVRVYDAGELPEVKNIRGSNFVDIGLVIDKRLNRAVVVSCIDNLVKGAAGQAVQNMNLIFGLSEDAGLSAAGLYL